MSQKCDNLLFPLLIKNSRELPHPRLKKAASIIGFARLFLAIFYVDLSVFFRLFIGRKIAQIRLFIEYTLTSNPQNCLFLCGREIKSLFL